MVSAGADSVTGALATMGIASVAGVALSPVIITCADRSVPSVMPPFTVALKTSDMLSPAPSAGTVHRPSA